MKASSLIHPESVVAINETFEKQSANSERHFFPFKIAIGVRRPEGKDEALRTDL
jgi:hypothetical protein